MRKVLILLCTTLLLSPTVSALAGPWAVVSANLYEQTPAGPTDISDIREALYTVDLGAVRPRLYGPFLQGELTAASGPGVFDVEMLPDHKTALVSTFGDMMVYRIDLSNPKNPVITGAVKMEYDTGELDPDTSDPIIYSFFAEDIAVSRDGTFAIVSDGGFSPYLGFIDLKTFTLTSIQKLEYDTGEVDPVTFEPIMAQRMAQAVAIGRDSKTVLFADYWSARLWYGKVQWTKDSLYDVESIWLCDLPDLIDPTTCDPAIGTQGRIVNVTISPDGKTAIAASAGGVGTDISASGSVYVFKIPRTGVVEPGSPMVVSGLPANDGWIDPVGTQPGNQSVAFLPNGTAAFVTTQPSADEIADPIDPIKRPNQLAKLRVLGPGRVKLVKARFARLFGKGTSQLFGVDTLAVSRNGRYALVGNPTLSGADHRLALVNLLTRRVTAIKLPTNAIPTGVVFK